MFETVEVKLVDAVQTLDSYLHLTWQSQEGVRRVQTDKLPAGHTGVKFFQPRVGRWFTISLTAWDEMQAER